MKLVLLSHIFAMNLNICLVLVRIFMTIISRVYELGTVNMCNFLNFSLQDVLCLYSNITLVVVFYIISALCRIVVEPHKIVPFCNNDRKCVK